MYARKLPHAQYARDARDARDARSNGHINRHEHNWNRPYHGFRRHFDINSVCIEIRCQIIFKNITSEKFINWKLLALGKGFSEKNWKDVTVPERVQSCFELSIHLSV